MATTTVADTGEAGGSKLGNILKAKEDLQKSPEQLEQEKREIIKQRVVSLNLDRKTKDDMVKIAEDFQNILINIHSQIYDLNERYDRQKYSMMELAERARQIEKGKAKTRKSNIVHTGLGGSVFSKLGDVFPSAPAKISLFSRYERVTDRRTYKDRRDCFMPKGKSDYVPHRPKAKIKPLDESKMKPKPTRKKRGEQPPEEEQPKEEAPPAEEEPPAEEPAAEEEPAEEE
jgi:flagellar biosynthesis/type III secretory pathway chaperone